MGISYDPEQGPDIDAEAMREGLEIGLTPINVMCLESDGQLESGVTFAVFVASVPRIGEHIILQDGQACEVRRVYHQVVKVPGYRFFSLSTTVYAVRSGPQE